MGYWKRFGNIFIDSFLMFRTNQVPIRASALSFSTMLSFMPLVVLLSWGSSLIGQVKLLNNILPLIQKTWGIEIPLELLQNLIAHSQEVSMAKLGILGSIFLVVTFLVSIANLEKALNIIWGLKKNRNWAKRLTVYTPFAIFVGLFILVNSWILARFQHNIYNILSQSLPFSMNGEIPFVLEILVMVLLTWIFISTLYLIIPYTRVRFRSAITGSTIITLLLFIYVYLAIKLQSLFFVRYSILYGSVASVPIIMVMLYLFWIIVLYGATLSYAHQKAHL